MLEVNNIEEFEFTEKNKKHLLQVAESLMNPSSFEVFVSKNEEKLDLSLNLSDFISTDKAMAFVAYVYECIGVGYANNLYDSLNYQKK